MWDWLGDNGNACERSFDSIGEAAENAVETMFPVNDWRHDAQNSDTKLGYIEWVEHNAESHQGY